MGLSVLLGSVSVIATDTPYVSSSVLGVDLSDSYVASVLSGVLLSLSMSLGFSVVLGSLFVLSSLPSVLSHGFNVRFFHFIVMGQPLGSVS